jgi:hypothetical protein
MVTTRRETVLESMDRLMDVTVRLVEQLQAAHASYETVRSMLAEGASTRDALSAVPTAELRRSLTACMADMETARGMVRRLTIAMGIEEGVSIGDMGRLWGFSRQLAARYAKEAQDG